MTTTLSTDNHGTSSRRVLAGLFVVFGLLAGIVFAQGDSRQVAAQVPPQVAMPADCTWTLVPSPNLNQYNTLNGVAPVAANDVWAVGSRGDSFTGQLTLIEHWNGSAW